MLFAWHPYVSQHSINPGGNDTSAMTPLALPASLGGHQSHVAAALTSSKQHLEQQKQLNAALQVDLTSIGKHRCFHYDSSASAK